MSDEIRTEPMFVLYGSQTGNSEQAAKDFCTELEEKFTSEYFEAMNLKPVKITTTCLQLDDFLEYEHSKFSKAMIVFVSSYGVGQAPIGSYKFRSFAEELLAQTESGKLKDLLKGLSYAVCGLGDSGYTTYLRNPTTIDNAFQAVGATQLIGMGKADAKQIGETSQANTILKWKEDLWIPLAKAVASEAEVDTDAMQQAAIPIYAKVDPDYVPPGGKSGNPIQMYLLAVAVLVAIVAYLVMSGM